MFIELTETQSKERVAININNIAEVFDAGGNRTYISKSNGITTVVEESYDVVMTSIINVQNDSYER